MKIFKKKSVAVLFFVALVGTSFSQQDAQYSHNMFNHLTVNPGFAGLKKTFCATLIGRKQWVQFPGAPTTYLLSLDAYVPQVLGGLGLTLTGDNLGNEKNFLARLAYSYHLPLQGGAANLGIGIEAGMISKSIKANWITPEPISVTGGWDPSIPFSNVKTTTYDLGLGLYYYTEKLKIGLSSSHLPEQTLDKKGGAVATGNAFALDFKMKRHYFLTAEYDYQTNNAEWNIKPSIMVKSDATSTQLDANLIVLWRKTLWAGASFRIQDAFVFLIGFQTDVPKGSATSQNKGALKIGYAFDLTRSDIKYYSKNTHEIMLNYCFNLIKPKKPESHQTVRFL